MRLWSYQHPAVLKTLQSGDRYVCRWEWVSGERWQNAFRFMSRQMALRGIDTGDYAPVWAWHSVNRPGGKPGVDCANALMCDLQLAQGVDLLELEVPDHQVLVSFYGSWNTILDQLIDGAELLEQDITECFDVPLMSRRGRPPHYFPDIQACLPCIEAAWLVSSEVLDTKKMLEDRRLMME